MALVGPTLLTADPDTTNTSSYATPSVSPTAGALLVAAVYNTDGSNAILPTLSSAFSVVGGSWAQEATAQNSSGIIRLTTFSAVATGTPGSGAVIADFAGDSQTGCIVIVVEYTGQDATDPVLQPQAAGHLGGAGATSRTETLAGALAAAGNQILAFIGHNANEGQTAGGGGTELASSDVGYNTPTNRLAAYSEVGDNSLSASWSTASVWMAAAMEIVEGGSSTEHFASASLDLTAGIDTVAKKDAKASAAVPLTAGIVAAAVKTAYAATSTPVVFGAAAAAVKTAQASASTPLVFGSAVAARKVAYASTVVPIVLTIETSADTAITVSASVEITFGASVAAHRTAQASAALPVTVNVATGARKTAYASSATQVVFNAAVAGSVTRFVSASLPIVFTAVTRMSTPSPTPNLDAVLTGWIAGPAHGHTGGGTTGRIRTPDTGGIA